MPIAPRFLPPLALLAALLPALLPAPGRAEDRISFEAVDPALAQALRQAVSAEKLRALGLDGLAAATLRITTANCPASCNVEVDLGMCFCRPEKGGDCARGATPDSRGREPWCKTLPDTVDIFASEGGLGTTRVTVTASGS